MSEMTIRRDIEALEGAGIVRRIAGGAIASGGSEYEPSYTVREGRAAGVKERIAQGIASLLSHGESVVLDSGSTVVSVARAIRGRGLGLTVVTPSIKVAVELADEPDTKVILAGGVVRPGELSLIGSDAERLIAQYNCDTYVAGVSGIDPQHGLTEYHPEEAAVKRAAMRSARRVIVGVDSEKLGRIHLVNIGPLASVGAIVTNAAPDHPTITAALDLGVEVVSVQSA